MSMKDTYKNTNEVELQDKKLLKQNLLSKLDSNENNNYIQNSYKNEISSKESLPSWQTQGLHKFIQFWQQIFNRRIISFCCFAIQVGDVLFFLCIIGYLIYACCLIHNEKKSGKATQNMMAICIVFGCRNGLLSYLFGLSIDRAIFWHKLMAWITLGLSLNHWNYARGIITGYIIEGVLISFIFFSIEPIRRYFWEFFMKIHWILIILMVIACIIHEVGLGLMASLYFLADVLLRWHIIKKNKDISNEIKLEKIGSNIVKIQMRKESIAYQGGQYFFIMIPNLSYYQWHPFSVFSSPNEDEIIFYIKVIGDWTQSLYKIAGEQNSPVTIQGYLDGPYGCHSISIQGNKYEHFLCIGGGIGVTPIISTTKQLLQEKKDGRPLKSIHFIWTGRDSEILDMIGKVDQDSILQTSFHLSRTGENLLNDIEMQNIQSQKQKQLKYILGRPDFSNYFERAFKQAQDNSNNLVGVIVCGPQSLLNDVQICAQHWSKQGIRFDVHQETFLF